MNEMFCFQCQQTAHNTGCTGKAGVCGKKADTANDQDDLIGALSEAFDCTVNDLPLTLVLSWYEQKAVCILLTLLYLGIQNIYLGPTVPAFVSENVLQVLRKNYNLTPTSEPEKDLNAILKAES